MIKINEAREKNGYNQKEFAKKINVAPNTLSNWETGKREPDYNSLIKIASVLNVSIDFLLGNKTKNGIKIPVLGKVAAGIPIDEIEEILDFEEIDERMVKDGSEYFGLQLKGDSMEPKMSDGDVVIVRVQHNIDSGNIAIVQVNGDTATCKKIVKHENGIVLTSCNPSYAPIFYSNEEIEKLPVSILGRVVELRAKFN